MSGVPCRVILLGMMGSGKTTVGHELSRRTGWPYHDNDALVEAATGRTARELAAEGPQQLRAAEASALRHALAMPEPAIAASAAGVVTDPELRSRLRSAGAVVWLRAPAETLAERTMAGAHRPWLDGDAVEWLETTAHSRAPLYREVATLEVDTASASPAEIVDRIVDWLRTTGCADALGTRLARVRGMDDRNERHGLPLPSEDTGDLQETPRGGDTDDYLVAREEGVPYVPPSERVMSEPRLDEGGPDFAGAARDDGMELRQSDTDDDLAARALEALRRSDVVAGDRLTLSATGSIVIVSGEVEADRGARRDPRNPRRRRGRRGRSRTGPPWRTRDAAAGTPRGQLVRELHVSTPGTGEPQPGRDIPGPRQRRPQRLLAGVEPVTESSVGENDRNEDARAAGSVTELTEPNAPDAGWPTAMPYTVHFPDGDGYLGADLEHPAPLPCAGDLVEYIDERGSCHRFRVAQVIHTVQSSAAHRPRVEDRDASPDALARPDAASEPEQPGASGLVRAGLPKVILEAAD